MDSSGELIAEDEEFRSAQAIVQHLQSQSRDIDAELSDSDRADLTAFQTLVQSALEPATLYTLWGESESFNRHTQVTVTPSSAVFSTQCLAKYMAFESLGLNHDAVKHHALSHD